MFCTQCGAQNHPDAKFCGACGAQIVVSVAPPGGRAQRGGGMLESGTHGVELPSSRSSGIDWYLWVLKKYAVFSGRAQRAEYWYFVLFNCLAIIGLVIIDSITGSFDDDAGIGLLSGLYYLGVLLPSLAVTVRRLHDTGRSGWWMLIALLPFLGGLILLFFTVQDSQPGGNQYGLNPKGVS